MDRNTRVAPVSELNLTREVAYIVRRAMEHDARCVSVGAFTLFSTETGDAWLLDAADGLALCLARGGEAQPARIIETESTVVVEWDRNYVIEGDCFTTTERKTGRTSMVLGYPTSAIAAAIQKARLAKG